MPVNVPIDDEILKELQGRRITLQINDSDKEGVPLAQAAFNDVEAILAPSGIIIGMELTPKELESIKNGQHVFLVHFWSQTGISPFRLIFNEADIPTTTSESNGTKDQNNFDLRLPDSPGNSETN